MKSVKSVPLGYAAGAAVALQSSPCTIPESSKIRRLHFFANSCIFLPTGASWLCCDEFSGATAAANSLNGLVFVGCRPRVGPSSVCVLFQVTQCGHGLMQPAVFIKSAHGPGYFEGTCLVLTSKYIAKAGSFSLLVSDQESFLEATHSRAAQQVGCPWPNAKFLINKEVRPAAIAMGLQDHASWAPAAASFAPYL